MKAFYNTRQNLYNRSETPVYDTNLIPEIKLIEQQYDVIKTELENVLKDPILYQKAFQKRRYAKSPNWKQIELLIYGLEFPQRIEIFPKTYQFLKGLKGVSTIYFSVLDEQSTIQPHNGDTDAFYRIHLGIKIPDSLPDCGLEVAGNQLAWEEGKCIAFNDIYYHSAWNHTAEKRIVLIIDMLRPEFIAEHKKINAGVVATLIYSRIYKYVGFVVELFPRIFTRAIHPLIHFFVYTYFKITRK